ncbi:hypothetical protein PoB_000359800 [Plakobranchus ocellatus]|uniref:Uncharacterized protein n=1 Tax=Plakobranchus ocellatus TaxID=259542 RepID=A0AAV3Y4H3_9GAST|nr:hypothetical protein PoB_000359800 [Plakobranchus ocellatus]
MIAVFTNAISEYILSVDLHYSFRVLLQTIGDKALFYFEDANELVLRGKQHKARTTQESALEVASRMKPNPECRKPAMSTADSEQANSGEVSSINVLRVADPATPSGLSLYSGLTVNTIMGPVRFTGQAENEDAVCCQSRGTQTYHNNTNNNAHTKNITKKSGFSCSRYKSQVSERASCAACRNQSNIEGKSQKNTEEFSSCVAAKQTSSAIGRCQKVPERIRDSNAYVKSCKTAGKEMKAEKLNESANAAPQDLTKLKNLGKSKGNKENEIVTNKPKTFNVDEAMRKSFSHDEYNKYARCKKQERSPDANGQEKRWKERTETSLPGCEIPCSRHEHFVGKINEQENVQITFSKNELNIDKRRPHADGLAEKQTAVEYTTSEQTEVRDGKKDETHLPARTTTTSVATAPATSIAALATSLPVVTWQESAADDLFPSRDSVQLSTYSMFEIVHRVLPPASSTGPKILVPPRHSCPEGLTVEDIVLGKCLKPGGEVDTIDQNLSTETHGQAGRNVKSLTESQSREMNPSGRRVKSAVTISSFGVIDGSNGKSSIPDHRVPPRPATSSAIPSEKNVSLELNIKSLNPVRQKLRETIAQTHGAAVTTHGRGRSTLSRLGLDTMEAIKRSYRRAQSAPPLASHSNCSAPKVASAVTSTRTPMPEGGRKFSNLYWRARSAYHRRNKDLQQDVYTERDSTGLSNLSDLPVESAQLKGTLLRPLMYTSEGGIIKHSSGCPYKCKNCFRACLVSDDFAQNARQRRQELLAYLRGGADRSEKAGPGRGSTSSKKGPYPSRRTDAATLITRALARSQPLFQRVYGNKGTYQKILPWPTAHAWVDIKQTRPDRADDIGEDNHT